MNILMLGCGKTGSLVAEVAREHGHSVKTLRALENPEGTALTPERLRDIAVVIDFTTPQAVIKNIEACVGAAATIVVGTTGWYEQLPRIKQMVKEHDAALLYGSNFSIGVNLFFEASKAAAAALHHRYSGQIFERHHTHKKDAPSGTALSLQKIIAESAGNALEITSFREGEVIGMHELILDSPHDRIYLCHDSKSRRGFAEGAVRAAEWVVGRKGLFDFREVWKQM